MSARHNRSRLALLAQAVLVLWLLAGCLPLSGVQPAHTATPAGPLPSATIRANPSQPLPPMPSATPPGLIATEAPFKSTLDYVPLPDPLNAPDCRKVTRVDTASQEGLALIEALYREYRAQSGGQDPPIEMIAAIQQSGSVSAIQAQLSGGLKAIYLLVQEGEDYHLAGWAGTGAQEDPGRMLPALRQALPNGEGLFACLDMLLLVPVE